MEDAGLYILDTDEDDLTAAPTVVFLLESAPARPKVPSIILPIIIPVVGLAGKGFFLVVAASRTGAVLFSTCNYTRFA